MGQRNAEPCRGASGPTEGARSRARSGLANLQLLGHVMRFAKNRRRGGRWGLLLMLTIRVALVDDQSTEVPGVHHHHSVS
jgi:hypothetical protein